VTASFRFYRRDPLHADRLLHPGIADAARARSDVTRETT
jgi:hypothetical protein